jgi:hypothetical protein
VKSSTTVKSGIALEFFILLLIILHYSTAGMEFCCCWGFPFFSLFLSFSSLLFSYLLFCSVYTRPLEQGGKSWRCACLGDGIYCGSIALPWPRIHFPFSAGFLESGEAWRGMHGGGGVGDLDGLFFFFLSSFLLSCIVELHIPLVAS